MPQDYVITLLTDDRPHLKGVHEETFITDKKIALVGFAYRDFQPIQTLIYNSYEIRVPKTESFRVEWIKYGRLITIYSGANTIAAKVVSVSLEEIEGSDFKNCVIQLYDYNLDNYPGRNYIQDYLKSDVIALRDNPYGIITLRTVIDGTQRHYYTYRFYETMASGPKEEVVNVNGLEVQSSYSNRQFYQLILYLGGEDAAQIMYDLPGCDGQQSQAAILFSGQETDIIERPEVFMEPVDGAIDLNKITVNFVYNSKKVYNYAI